MPSDRAELRARVPRAARRRSRRYECARDIAGRTARTGRLSRRAPRCVGSRAGRPIVFVVEDVHWADEATLDLLTFLGRRISDLAALLVITFRDDEIGPLHPLRVRLGDLAAVIRTRIQLRPLSPAAVARLAT